MTKKGENCQITIYGVSIGTFKEAKMTCEYGSSVEIDKSLIGSPVSNISIGASIDRSKKATDYLHVSYRICKHR